MSFLKRVKTDLDDRSRGIRELVTVDRRSLTELVDHFERLDSSERASQPVRDLNENLNHAIEAVYKNNKCSETTLLIIMRTLKPLIDERLKEKAITEYRGY